MSYNYSTLETNGVLVAGQGDMSKLGEQGEGDMAMATIASVTKTEDPFSNLKAFLSEECVNDDLFQGFQEQIFEEGGDVCCTTKPGFQVTPVTHISMEEMEFLRMHDAVMTNDNVPKRMHDTVIPNDNVTATIDSEATQTQNPAHYDIAQPTPDIAAVASNVLDQIPDQILQQLQQMTPEMQKQMLPQIIATLQLGDITKTQQWPSNFSNSLCLEDTRGIGLLQNTTLYPAQQQQQTGNITSDQSMSFVTAQQEQQHQQHSRASSMSNSTQMMDNQGFSLYPVQELQNQSQGVHVSRGTAVTPERGPIDSNDSGMNPVTGTTSVHLAQSDHGASYQQSSDHLDNLELNTISAMKSSIDQEIEKTQRLVESQQILVKSQLNSMEMLSHSMEQNVMSHTLIHQISGRSLTSECSTVSSSGQGSSRNLGSRQQSGRNLMRQGSNRSLGNPSSAGRGFGRPVVVSGRGRGGGLGKQGSWRNISNGSDVGLENGKFAPMKASRRLSNEAKFRTKDASHVLQAPGRVLHRRYSNPSIVVEPSPVLPECITRPNKVERAMSLEPSPVLPECITRPNKVERVMSLPGRGIHRHRSNPTLGHTLQQLELGALNIHYDGMSDADSI